MTIVIETRVKHIIIWAIANNRFPINLEIWYYKHGSASISLTENEANTLIRALNQVDDKIVIAVRTDLKHILVSHTHKKDFPTRLDIYSERKSVIIDLNTKQVNDLVIGITQHLKYAKNSQ